MTVKMRRGRRTRKRSCRDDVGTPRVSVASVRALLAESAAARESATTAPRTSNAPTLTVQIPPGISPAAANAQLASRGLALNALLVNAFSAPNFGETDDLTPYLTALEQMVVTVRSGDLGDAEGLLLAQAVQQVNNVAALTTVPHAPRARADNFPANELLETPP